MIGWQLGGVDDGRGEGKDGGVSDGVGLEEEVARFLEGVVELGGDVDTCQGDFLREIQGPIDFK